MMPMTTVLIKGREGKDTDTHREEGHVKTESETGIILTQVKKCQDPPDSLRSKEGLYISLCIYFSYISLLNYFLQFSFPFPLWN